MCGQCVDAFLIAKVPQTHLIVCESGIVHAKVSTGCVRGDVCGSMATSEMIKGL